MGNELSDGVKMKHIEDCVMKSDRIFIDTCSILFNQSELYLERLSSVLRKTGKKLYIQALCRGRPGNLPRWRSICARRAAIRRT